MSFNVTQCPACESTFNTNSRVLAAAAGRVRCGACLNVFQAIDNFLVREEADTAQNQDESVFVGNDPQEFFDPSSFLTRSALSETHADEVVDTPIDEQNLRQELEEAETVSEDFFATVAGELQGRAEAPALGDRLEDKDKRRQIDQPASLQASNANESIDEEFEIGFLDSFATEEADAHELVKDESVDSSLEEHIDSEPIPIDAEETHIESKDSILGTGLSASFTFNLHGPPEVGIGELDADSPLDTKTASEQSIDANAASDAESNKDNEQPLLEALEADAQDVTIDALLATETNAVLEPSADSIANNENMNVHNEAPSAEADNIETVSKREELAGESVAENKNKESSSEVERTSAPEVDDESTEAIRARVLEAELSDEEALEAIPQENLAALGGMTTPVELLARKESHLLRSTLLFLSILLLAGLLSSQYLWQRMELYSQLPQLRPVYEVACTYLNCSLPQYADIDAIRSENLTVQTHPSLANGLMVNTVIRNTAAFEQPFPILILSFNSVENSVIALREFTSAEYLDPRLRSIQAMPVRTPVQIGLAIMDPGPEAVNYTLAFRWP